LREDLLARADDLDRPSEVPATFARLYAEMSEIYRYQGDSEQERFWQKRAQDESAAITGPGGSDDAVALNQQAVALYFSGDCSGAAAAVEKAIAADPQNIDAYFSAAVYYYFQGRYELADQQLQHVLELRPNDVRALEQRALLAWTRVMIAGDYFEPAYLN